MSEASEKCSCTLPDVQEGMVNINRPRAKSAEVYRSQSRAQSAKSTRSAVESRQAQPSYNAATRAAYLRRLKILMVNFFMIGIVID